MKNKFDFFIYFLIIISIILFSIETIPNLSQNIISILNIINSIIYVIFIIEYIYHIYTNKFKFIFSFYGIIDALVIIPFFLFLTIDLKVLRSFRLLRLIKILKFLKNSKIIKNFKQIFFEIKNELYLFLVSTFILILFAGFGIYLFEHNAQPENFGSIFHGLWWAVITLTTIGYGDIYPITVGGKIFTSFISILGLGVVAAPAGLFASTLTKIKL